MVVRQGLAIIGLVLVLGMPARAQSPVPPPPPAAAVEPPPADVNVEGLPISVDRIGRQLARPSTISLQVSQPMFRVEVVEKRPRWFADIEWLPLDEQRLPQPYGPAWHRDFLGMVTPEMARPFGQASGWDLLQLMATSLVEGMATNSVVHALQKRAAKRREAAAREEVDATIEAWKVEQDHLHAMPPGHGAAPDAGVGGATTGEPPPAASPPR